MKDNSAAILAFMRTYIDAHFGIPPSTREIGEAVNMRQSVVAYNLRKMKKRGSVISVGRGARQITIPEMESPMRRFKIIRGLLDELAKDDTQSM